MRSGVGRMIVPCRWSVWRLIWRLHCTLEDFTMHSVDLSGFYSITSRN